MNHELVAPSDFVEVHHLPLPRLIPRTDTRLWRSQAVVGSGSSFVVVASIWLAATREVAGEPALSVAVTAGWIDGRAAITEVRVVGEQVRQRDYDRIPHKEVLRLFLHLAYSDEEELTNVGGRSIRRLATATPPPKRRRITPAFLGDVAAVYRANPAAPVLAVAQIFNVSHRQAQNYVRAAADLGLLPTGKPGRKRL